MGNYFDCSSHNIMDISRLMLLSAVVLLCVFQLGFTRPYIYSYNFQLPSASAGVVITTNHDGSQSVHYLTDREAQTVFQQQQAQIASLISIPYYILQNLFSHFPFFG